MRFVYQYRHFISLFALLGVLTGIRFLVPAPDSEVTADNVFTLASPPADHPAPATLKRKTGRPPLASYHIADRRYAAALGFTISPAPVKDHVIETATPHAEKRQRHKRCILSAIYSIAPVACAPPARYTGHRYFRHYHEAVPLPPAFHCYFRGPPAIA